MKRVDIGGQAVLEGVMMKSPDAIAIAVRRPDGSIVVKRDEYAPVSKKYPILGWPFIRGIVNMGMMLSMGMRTLTESGRMLGEDTEEPTKFEIWLSKKLGKGIDKIIMGVAVVIAIVMAVGLFFALPEGAAAIIRTMTDSKVVINLLSGVVRIAIFIGYILFCGKVPDVRRTFQYHGAEHKTVYCNEHGEDLTPENAAKYSTLHPRCGTAFLVIVLVLGILLFTVVGYNGDVYLLRLLSRLALLPILAGISYELLKALSHSENKLVRALRWPGMMLQKLTTKEPTLEMIEVAIAAMEAALGGLPEGEKTAEGYVVIPAKGKEIASEKAVKEADKKADREVAEEPPEDDTEEAAEEAGDAEDVLEKNTEKAAEGANYVENMPEETTPKVGDAAQSVTTDAE